HRIDEGRRGSRGPPVGVAGRPLRCPELPELLRVAASRHRDLSEPAYVGALPPRNRLRRQGRRVQQSGRQRAQGASALSLDTRIELPETRIPFARTEISRKAREAAARVL